MTMKPTPPRLNGGVIGAVAGFLIACLMFPTVVVAMFPNVTPWITLLVVVWLLRSPLTQLIETMDQREVVLWFGRKSKVLLSPKEKDVIDNQWDEDPQVAGAEWRDARSSINKNDLEFELQCASITQPVLDDNTYVVVLKITEKSKQLQNQWSVQILLHPTYEPEIRCFYGVGDPMAVECWIIANEAFTVGAVITTTGDPTKPDSSRVVHRLKLDLRSVPYAPHGFVNG